MTRADEAWEAMKDGKAARRQGAAQSANPHPQGCRDHANWNMGWISTDVDLIRTHQEFLAISKSYIDWWKRHRRKYDEMRVQSAMLALTAAFTDALHELAKINLPNGGGEHQPKDADR